MRLLRVCACAALLALSSSFGAESSTKGMVVLGIDGMDPVLLERFIGEGALPNLAQLAQAGGFARLGTSIPPQSPVAWSNFITGMDPGGHGIFDFLALDRATLTPRESTSGVVPPARAPLRLGTWQIPLGSARPALLRDGESFWEILERSGVAATLISMPANYPPVRFSGRALSGMGTPDLQGTPGVFSFFTDDPSRAPGPVSGGVIEAVHLKENHFQAELTGPGNPYRVGEPPARAAFDVYVDANAPVAAIEIGDERRLLRVGEWSGWVPLRFDWVPRLHGVSGMVRFYLKSLHPHVELYASPVNIDPADPAQPISVPPRFAAELADAAGRFYTEEMPEDTKAVAAGVLSPAEFVAQSALVLEERSRLLDGELAHFRDEGSRGLLFFYFSTLDQRSHMLWRQAEEHGRGGGGTDELANALRDTYRELDALVGRTFQSLAPGVRLVVMSDHGFQSFRRQAHLNRWLEVHGYLALADPDHRERAEFLEGLDWTRTRAFAIGLNSLYLNVRGRERFGSVAPEQRAALARELAEQLLAWRDPQTGAAVVTQVATREEVYHGPHVEEAPDLIVGYGESYRASWATTSGRVPDVLLEDNAAQWSGDHCVDSRLVPGVLLSNGPLREPGDLRDLTVSILAYFDAEIPARLSGRALF